MFPSLMWVPGIFFIVAISFVKCSHPHQGMFQSLSDKDMSLDLVFLHMRKAGGSTIIETIGNWVRAQHCTDKFTPLGVLGMKSGHIFLRNHSLSPVSICPGLTIVHNEFSCLNVKTILNFTAPIGARKSNLRLLTMLRHPIRRIISQAFYSGFATRIIEAKITEMCNVTVSNIGKSMSLCQAHPDRDTPAYPIILATKQDRGSNYTSRRTSEVRVKCSCLYAAQEAGVADVRMNETGWLNWMAKVDFIDTYMHNYYVKRLSGGTRNFKNDWVARNNSVSVDLWSDLWGDWRPQGVPPPPSAVTGPKLSTQASLGSDSFEALQALFQGSCRRIKSETATEEMLLQAQLVLEKHFVVLILEYFGDHASHKMLHDILGGRTVSENFGKRNGGILSINDAVKSGKTVKGSVTSRVVSTINEDVKDSTMDVLDVEEFALKHMPPSIYAKIVAQNELDIQLFTFAVNLYKERAKSVL